MSDMITVHGLQVARPLLDLIEKEIAPGSGISSDHFWKTMAALLQEFALENERLLKVRARLQVQLNEWHHAHRDDATTDITQYKSFLSEIGYLVEEGEDFSADPLQVDAEIARIAGPQLVVPVDNARYALNAANARWGSLYDALYGTDVLPEDGGAKRGTAYNPVRGQLVMQYASDFLDQATPLATGSHRDVIGLGIDHTQTPKGLVVKLANGVVTTLAKVEQFAGYVEENGLLSSVLLSNNGLYLDILIDANDLVGREHPAGIKDVIVESALTTIQDCEDSVAAVDVEDKVQVYRNWNGIMQGTLQTEVSKGGEKHVRRLKADRQYTDVNAKPLTLMGRSLLLVRNVGMHMYTDAVLNAQGDEIPEGFLDAMVTVLAAKHDLNGNNQFRNSREGSVYIVKPKLHGPEEVSFTVQLFTRIEQAFGLAKNTLKIGIMDEERRTSVNLKECIRAASERVIFINTGFLDRTGDEIHTVMEAGPVVPKAEMKAQTWLLAYEDSNVDVGLRAGLQGRAQIGKGMWAIPDEMKNMLATKIAHPLAGANTAWVPSPTAATLHAMHYHQVNVAARQDEISKREAASCDDILTLALLRGRNLDDDAIREELHNNAQSILGYVVRWVDHGVGCSKVPDINNVGLMEDRATLRISSQHIANWLHHGVVTAEQVCQVFEHMAKIVDAQNAQDPNYRPMSADLANNIAYQAALDLVFKGREQANGYTEWTLHARRKQAKAA